MKLHGALKVLLMAVALAGGLIYPGAMQRKAIAQPVNLAYGKSVTVSNPPNYALCTDPDDDIELTDGVYAPGPYQIWTHPETVGWQYINPVTITVDLGTVKAISGVAFSTAAGCCGVNWPSSIYIAVSNDGTNWHYAGNLVTLADDTPPASGYAAFVYKTDALQTVGRYVTLIVNASSFIFSDEIEIYEGDSDWLNYPLPGPTFFDFTSLAQFGQNNPNWQPAPVNIALGKNVTFNTPPNYSYCTDPEDAIQVTDGNYTNGYFWTQLSTVGWSHENPAIITIDLGSVQSISGISFDTAAGTAGVSWPTTIPIAVSDDNVTWHYQGDLRWLADESPPASGYSTFTYYTNQLHTKGRYVAIGVVSSPYIFTDEIEVYRGDDDWLNDPIGGDQYDSMEELITARMVTALASSRLQEDLDSVNDLLDSSTIPTTLKEELQARLAQDQLNIQTMGDVPSDFKAILPFNDTQKDILAVRGEILGAQGFAPLTIWKLHRYAWLSFLQTPSTQQTAQLSFSMLKNQYRSDALLLTNATGDPMTVTLQLQNPPAGAAAGWLQMDYAEWTDTAQNIPVADALKPIPEQNGIYQITIPAGLTRKIWCTADSSSVPAGSYNSSLLISTTSGGTTVPVSVDVSSLEMNTPRYSLGMWDYSNGNGRYAITTQNRSAAIALMRSHFVNTPWAANNSLPTVSASYFDAQGNLTQPLDFTNLDQWINLWPGAKQYFIFASVSSSFTGAATGTPQFNARVGSWAQALSQHMTSLGLLPQQLGLLLVDEPHSTAQDDTISAWASAINAAAPELTLFEDPTWTRPDQTANQAAITSIDVLCPNLPVYRNGGTPVEDYFDDLRDNGKTLWFYQCTGPTRLYSPQAYYRYQAWFAFSHGATGQGFWSFGDTGGAPTSWNEYQTTGTSYAPAFLDTTTVYDSIHWDSVREGVEDYEEFAMLKDAIAATSDPTQKAQAQAVLDTSLQTILNSWSSNYLWDQAVANPGAGDAQLQNVRNMLETLNP